jgi:hypothetical protein
MTIESTTNAIVEKLFHPEGVRFVGFGKINERMQFFNLIINEDSYIPFPNCSKYLACNWWGK